MKQVDTSVLNNNPLNNRKSLTRKEIQLLGVRLNPAGLRLFLWLIYTVDPSEDWLLIDHLLFMEENNLKSIKTYKKGVKELLENHILATTEYSRNNYYYINKPVFASFYLPKYISPDCLIVSDVDCSHYID